MALGGFLDKAKKAAEEAQKAATEAAVETRKKASVVAKDARKSAAEAQKKASATAVEARKKASVVAKDARKSAAEAQKKASVAAVEARKKAMTTATNVTGLSEEEINARLAEAGEVVTEAATTAGNAIGSAAATTGEYAVKAGKTVSGVQAYQDRKEATKLHEESDAIVAEIEKGNERKRKQLNDCLTKFGRVRTEALHAIVGRFLRILDEMGKRNKSKEYEMMGVADISMDNVAQMQQLDMGASEALKTLGVAGGFAGIALAGTPALVTGAVTALATASTGTAISTLSGAAATNAVLAWLGGGSIAAGGGGMAAGATVLAGITYAATGVFAVAAAGIVATAFYSKKLTEATAEKARVEKWAAEVRQGWVIMDGIRLRAEELRKLTEELARRGEVLMDRLQEAVPTFDSTNMEHVRLFQQAALLVKSMTELAQTPLLDDDGNISSSAISVQTKLETVLNNDLK